VPPRELPPAVDRVDGRPYTEVDVAPASLRRITVTASRARRVLRAEAPGAAPYSPSFDPQTHALVFHAGRDRTALREAALDAEGMVAGTSTVREDGSRSYHAQVSPDGSRLAFDSDVDGPRGVYVSNRDGSDARRVSGSGHASVPSWSPDGEYLAFARAEPRRSRVWNVWTVHLATGRLERRTSHRVGQPWGASWFPDGRRLAYSLEGELVVRDLQTGTTRIYRSPLRGRLVRTPAVSPDGRRIVFQVRHDGAWVLDLESGTPSRILADASAEEFAWSPDGRRVAYHSLRGGEWGIWLLDLAP
jgi:Tol biopolymer transport system component